MTHHLEFARELVRTYESANVSDLKASKEQFADLEVLRDAVLKALELLGGKIVVQMEMNKSQAEAEALARAEAEAKREAQAAADAEAAFSAAAAKSATPEPE